MLSSTVGAAAVSASVVVLLLVLVLELEEVPMVVRRSLHWSP